MKILVISHTYIVDLNRQKLRALAKLEPGIEVTVVVPRRWNPGGVQNKIVETQFLEEGSFQVVPVFNLSENNQSLLLFGSELIKLLQGWRPDIIQVEQGSKALAYAQAIALNSWLGLRAKNVFFTWWNLPYEVKWPIAQLEAYNLRHTDGLIAGNQDAAEILRQRGYSRPYKVMPQLGVEESLFRPQPQPELQAELRIKANDFIVGFVGRFVEEKGLLTLAKALAGLRDRPWKWLLLGRGPLQEKLIQWADENRLQDRFIWVESVPHDRVYRYINLMNVLVLPSETTDKIKNLTSRGWKEQFGHVLIEAMACQVPTIGSDSGEIPNVIGDSGQIFPEGNVPALQNCLDRLMDSPALAEEHGKRGWKRVMELYTNQALAQQLLQFYKELGCRV